MSLTAKDLKDAVLRFVYNNVDGVDNFQGSPNPNSMTALIDNAVVTAMNNARLYAEKNANFEALEVTVLATLAPNGVINLNELTLNEETIRMNGLLRAALVVDGSSVPIGMMTAQTYHRQLQEAKRLGFSSLPDRRLKLLKSGTTLKPSQVLSTTVTVELSGYRWMKPYTADGLEDETDFLIEEGFDFMMWQTILEMNHIVKVFVPRTEGALSPPERARDAAWAGLLTNDAHSAAAFYNEDD